MKNFRTGDCVLCKSLKAFGECKDSIDSAIFETFISGFLSGIIHQRISQFEEEFKISYNVNKNLCITHINKLKEMSALISNDVIGPKYKFLLNFGFLVVK